MVFEILGLLLGIIGGLLGAWGGAEDTSKGWRRYALPLFITAIAILVIQHWFVLSILSVIAVLTIGYGIPDNFTDDEGSPLGRFYYKLFKGNHLLADIFTRGTIGLLTSLCLISLPILIGGFFIWCAYIITSLIIIAVYSLLSWRSLGGFMFLKKYLTFSEFVVYYAFTAGAIILIFRGI